MSGLSATAYGAWSEPKPATAETQDIAEKVNMHHTLVVQMQVCLCECVKKCIIIVHATCNFSIFVKKAALEKLRSILSTRP